MIKLKDLLKELADEGHLGVIDLIAFYKQATDEQRIEFERLRSAKKWGAARKLIQQITKIKIHSYPQRMPDPPPAAAAGWEIQREL